MEITIGDIVNRILENFDFSYMLTINILTYIIIKVIDYANGEKILSRLMKRVCLCSAILFMSVIYWCLGYENYITLVNSAIAAPVFYSWCLKPILKFYKIGYNDIDNTLE